MFCHFVLLNYKPNKREYSLELYDLFILSFSLWFEQTKYKMNVPHEIFRIFIYFCVCLDVLFVFVAIFNSKYTYFCWPCAHFDLIEWISQSYLLSLPLVLLVVSLFMLKNASFSFDLNGSGPFQVSFWTEKIFLVLWNSRWYQIDNLIVENTSQTIVTVKCSK